LVGVALITEGARTTVSVGRDLVIWRQLGLLSARHVRKADDLKTARLEERATGEVRLVLEFSDEIVSLGPWEPGLRRRLLSRCERAVDELRGVGSDRRERPSDD
jgi:hypothetical protein